MIKLISIDIDGTLLNPALEVTPKVKETIQEAVGQGIKIVITTGRALSGVYPILNELGLAQRDEEYTITYNGGLTQTTSGKVVNSLPISYEEAQLIDKFNHHKGEYTQFETAGDSYTTWLKINEYGSLENMLIHSTLVICPDELPKNISYIKGLTAAPKDTMDRIENDLTDELKSKFNIIRTGPWNIDFINKDASKGNAMLDLAKKLGIEQSETMAIGDQLNDLPMIKAAGIGVAMGNAIDEIKQVSDVVTNDNAHDGVAKAIKDYALN